eukprot:gene19618-21554_t
MHEDKQRSVEDWMIMSKASLIRKAALYQIPQKCVKQELAKRLYEYCQQQRLTNASTPTTSTTEEPPNASSNIVSLSLNDLRDIMKEGREETVPRRCQPLALSLASIQIDVPTPGNASLQNPDTLLPSTFLVDLPATFSRLSHHIPINTEAQQVIAWWAGYLSARKGKDSTLDQHTTCAFSMPISTATSCQQGCGIFASGRWMSED